MSILGRLAEMIRGIFQNRLLRALLAISLVPLVILGLSMYYLASDAIMNQAKDRLAAVRTIKANQIQSYFHSIQDQIQTNSTTLTIPWKFQTHVILHPALNGILNDAL